MTASIRDALPPHQRELWDRTWLRLLAPLPDEQPGDNAEPQPTDEQEQPERAA